MICSEAMSVSVTGVPSALIATAMPSCKARSCRAPARRAAAIAAWSSALRGIGGRSLRRVRTELEDRALRAAGLLGLTDLPAMTNQVHVELVNLIRRHQLLEDLVGLLSRSFAGYESQPLTDAVYM